jgi:spermidine dehydrogenase
MAVRRKNDWLDYARIVSGALCLAAGLAKPFPQVENVADRFKQMAQANAGTLLAPLSDLIVAHQQVSTLLVAFGLAGSGTAFLLNRLIAPAAAGQLVMFALFVALLLRVQPAIVAIDFPFIAVAALLLRRESMKE